MTSISKSHKLNAVCYDIRGPVLEEANRMEEEGQRILKLNIGNPAPFGFDAPDEILQDVIYNLAKAEGYCESKGLFSARKAVMQHCQKLNIKNVAINDIYMGNGVSELIVMTMQALLNNGDELLIPAPDYPLWTAAVNLAGGNAIHYKCDEQKGWFPDIDDIEAKITPRTRAILLINPNNPTGAVYSKELIEQVIALARKHNLMLFSDEIYDKILYDEAQHIPTASLADDVFIITFNGLSKSYRLAGFRSGWMILSGAKEKASNYIEGIDMLASMRLCANVPAQYAVQTALGGYQSINDLVIDGGRLKEQRDLAWQKLDQIPGVSCVKPEGAIYMFPHLDPEIYPIADDEQFVLDLLQQEKILLVHGSAFNLDDTHHVRIVFLPHKEILGDAIDRFAAFLERYRNK
ncbi:Glutamate-pyruvate aminotransferase AlaA [Sinobacterium norvegicum]|uniref:alanine transaminase n=1 Tax=Sinobacterium norvegicum TaxID=1641715 RepID=A0ABN8EK24_9GAMM|nr:pyridoxal phosphate-dependent aminotransferase [Sinobacterium norvegicum]CAH0992717.1 Glutamate-pyruvate aminotransferase AlaA [Sinobacterium norvegicum]